MAVTWEQVKKCKDYSLDLSLLEEVRLNLAEGREVHIGEKVLTRQDIKDVQKLIDRQLETIKAE